MTNSLWLPDELTPEEKSAIRALNRLAKRWPRSLMIASMAGTLHVLRCNEDGGSPMRPVPPGWSFSESPDPDASVYSTSQIPNTGGDW